MLEDMVGYNFDKRKPHVIGSNQREYYNDLAKTADIKNIPNVYSGIYDEAVNRVFVSHKFRDDKYTIIDDNSFSREVEE